MASNMLSRLLPPITSPSIYETFKEDQGSDTDVEERAGLVFDRDHLDDDVYNVHSVLNETMGGPIRLGGSLEPHYNTVPQSSRGRRPIRHQRTPGSLESDEANDDVPASLLVESGEGGNPISPGLPARRLKTKPPKPMPVVDAVDGGVRAKWDAAQEQQRLHKDQSINPSYAGRPGRRGRFVVDPKEKALWRWANVQNLDNFLKDVYQYYTGKGIYSITLRRVLNLLTFAFVISFSIFLTSCIDYSNLRNSNKMSGIYVKQCTRHLSGFTNFLIWICAFCWIGQLVLNIADIRRLKHFHDFFHHLLEIPDTDIQTVSWQDIVKRLMDLRDANPTTATNTTDRHRRFMESQSKQRMDAHDIANRLMRRENYLIALINKDILNLTLPIPFFKNRQIFTQGLEWNLGMCILDFMFDERGQVKPMFLKDKHRKGLSYGLRTRFFVIGIISIITAPGMLAYVLLVYFFRNFSEYQKDPSAIGSREYTPFAKWKFREFNELVHLFDRRMNMSYPFASRYINQFPKDKMVLLANFVVFISGALAAVLAIISLVDPDLFLGFEITPERTVLFYLGVLSTIWAFARGTIPEEFLVYDPEFFLNSVINFTHYVPANWKGRLHTDEVRKEFVEMYQLKLVIFLEEILSMVTTPFVLIFVLPKCSERIIDFVREFTIHVDGLGHVCSYAVFDFEKGGNAQKQNRKLGNNGVELRDDYYATKDNKMLASYYNFMDHYVTNPHQRPGQSYQHGGKQFHPPPAFPGMMSSQGEGLSRAAGRTEQGDRHQLRSGTFNMGGGLGTRVTPRMTAVGGHQSPIASILLDPQHQPQSLLKSLHRPSRLRNSRRPVTDVIEDDENEEITGQGPSNALDAGDDGNLDDSWMMKAGRTDESDEGEGNDAGNGQGVLGLVYQFSKAQTGDRRPGAQL